LALFYSKIIEYLKTWNLNYSPKILIMRTPLFGVKSPLCLFMGLFLFFSISSTQAQQKTLKPGEMVEEAYQKGVTFEPVNLFSPVTTTSSARERIASDLTDYQLFSIDPSFTRQAASPVHTPKVMAFQIGGTTLDLVKVDLFSPDFRVVTSSGKEANVDLGTHYRGTIQGDPNSVAAVSIYKDDVVAVFSDDQLGNVTLAKMKESADTYILYRDLDLKDPPGFECSTDDNVNEFVPEPDTPISTMALADQCVRFYYEVDKDIHDDKGGVQGATNYITALSNEVQTIYGNENINTTISEIFVWDTTSPYSGSVSTMRTQFQNRTSSINGDLGQLLTYKGSGGIAAGFNGICPNNVDASLSVSSISSSFQAFPNYTFTVMVVTHEFGHTFGSRHTHACVWNGNNTAIDGCSGTEGSCPRPGNPSGGGTIMSYCHLQSVGINFNRGFGPQPGDLIRSRVTNGSCLSGCGGGGGPTCTDGVQNGQETGVDCGGPDCPSCPTTCSDNEVTLSITFDNYPEETAWTLRNDAGATVASGGTYGNQPDGSTLAETFCLPNDCYTFTITDSFGDGICCGFGNGSYSLTGPDGSIVSGGSFTTSEATDFCLGGPPAPTCDDGIQNGQETGVDCGGPDCPDCPPTGGDCTEIDFTSTTINSYGGTQDAGTSDVLASGALRIQNNAWKAITLNYTVTPNTVIEFDFGSTRQGEIHGIGFDNDNGISSNRTFQGNFYTGSFNRLFFVADHDAGGRNGNSYFRNVKIYEGNSCSTTATPDGDLSLPQGPVVVGQQEQFLYPNPARDIINLNFRYEGPAPNYTILGAMGNVVKSGRLTGDALDVSQLAAGAYFIVIQDGTKQQPLKFIKQ